MPSSCSSAATYSSASYAADGRSLHALSFAHPGKEQYAAVEGRGRIVTDRSLIERLWNPAAGVYFDSKDDPDIGVLEITATGGEYWDGPSTKVGQALSMVLTKVRGETTLDEHGDIEA